jgi:hypothetical protein
MSKGHSPRPYDAERYGQNFDRIFRRDDPMRALKPGSLRIQLSDCCGTITRVSEGRTYHICDNCNHPCKVTLTDISQ